MGTVHVRLDVMLRNMAVSARPDAALSGKASVYFLEQEYSSHFSGEPTHIHVFVYTVAPYQVGVTEPAGECGLRKQSACSRI